MNHLVNSSIKTVESFVNNIKDSSVVKGILGKVENIGKSAQFKALIATANLGGKALFEDKQQNNLEENDTYKAAISNLPKNQQSLFRCAVKSCLTMAKIINAPANAFEKIEIDKNTLKEIKTIGKDALNKINDSTIKKLFSFIAMNQGIENTNDVKVRNQAQLLQLESLTTVDKVEKIVVQTPDKVNLETMHFQAKNPKDPQKTILICSGSGASFEHYVTPTVKAFTEMGANVMVFNYRGFGDSTGNPSENGLYTDAEAVYNHLISNKQLDEKSIVVYGYSLGSGPATHLATQHESSLILDRPFTSLREKAIRQAKEDAGENKVIQKIWGKLAEVIFKMGGNFDNTAKAPSVKGSVFLATGLTNDTTSTKDEIDKMKNAFESRKNKIQTDAQLTHIDMDIHHIHHGGNPDNSEASTLWFEKAHKSKVVNGNTVVIKELTEQGEQLQTFIFGENEQSQTAEFDAQHQP